jgi:hypothetical protein
VVALTGAIVSLLFFIVASLHRPLFLQILIGGWVLSPFVVYAAASRLVSAVRPLDIAVMISTVLAVVVYAYAVFGSPTWKAAAPFVMVPLASLILMLLATVAAAVAKPATR